MLNISKPLSASQAQTYHAKEFTSAEQNYWQQKGATLGEWHGELARKFGLAGAVSADDFARLAQGQHPVTGDQLVSHRVVHEYQSPDGKIISPVEHRAGWDATFSAPKSVSLTALVGHEDRVREAHREAVNFALSELERYTQARIGGNHPAETTGKFVAATFEHDTARPVDGYAAPQLHTHAVIFNMTERDDGTMRALQPRSLFESQQFATAVYQSSLTFRLSQLGYELETGRSGAPEIKGFSREYLDASSPRSQQIREYMEKNGYEGHEAAQIAAHSTRDNKQILSQQEVLSAHQKLADQYENQAEQVVSTAKERSQLPEFLESVSDRNARAQEAVSYARDRSFEREAVTDERLLFRDALRRGMGVVTYPEIRSVFENRVHQREFQLVSNDRHDTARQFTTSKTIEAEKAVIEHMISGQDTSQQIMPIQEAVQLTDSQPKLNAAQRKAAEQILTSSDQIQGIQGVAGSGKSSVLDSIRQGAETHGFAVEGFAPTSRAAQQLRDSGISAGTLQGFLAQGGREELAGDSTRKHLYMLDESSLASTRQMRDFVERLGPHDKVLLVGDTRQHLGVDAGKPFEQLQQAGMHTAQLDQIIRQKDPELLKAVEHLSRHETALGIAILRQHGSITQIAGPQQRFEAIAKSYAMQPERTLIVSPDNASRRQINEAVRQELKAHGIIDGPDHQFKVLVPRSEMTGADRRWASQYDVGDVLRYQRGSKELELTRSSYAEVIAVDAKSNLIMVQRDSGGIVGYDPSRVRGIDAYRETEKSFAVGDRLQMTAPHRDLDLPNRALGTVEQITNGELTVRMDSGRTVTFDPHEMRHFDHGYAVTSHSSQGLTAERVLINMDTQMHSNLINARFAYVSISRGSHEAQIFTNNANELGEHLSHDLSKTSAMSVTEEEKPTKTLTEAQSLMTPEAEIGVQLST
jgi:conjugative relaxase-like TrwC/TraI family protein